VLAAAAQYDDFTARLLDVLRATRAERAARAGCEVVFGVHRSDYMLDYPSGRFLQVGWG
jgi:glutathione synthase